MIELEQPVTEDNTRWLWGATVDRAAVESDLECQARRIGVGVQGALVEVQPVVDAVGRRTREGTPGFVVCRSWPGCLH